MGREIKFRAWDIRNKRFGYFDFQANLFSMPSIEWMERYVCGGGEATRFPDIIGWQQFTGLRDKNGVEIYEGDIVKNYVGEIAEIRWFERLCGFELSMISGLGKQCMQDDLEIIGNIHEHSSLLKTGGE